MYLMDEADMTRGYRAMMTGDSTSAKELTQLENLSKYIDFERLNHDLLERILDELGSTSEDWYYLGRQPSHRIQVYNPFLNHKDQYQIVRVERAAKESLYVYGRPIFEVAAEEEVGLTQKERLVHHDIRKAMESNGWIRFSRMLQNQVRFCKCWVPSMAILYLYRNGEYILDSKIS